MDEEEELDIDIEVINILEEMKTVNNLVIIKENPLEYNIYTLLNKLRRWGIAVTNLREFDDGKYTLIELIWLYRPESYPQP